MTNPIQTKLLIIGSGPAGYTAAIYAARAMLDPLLVQGDEPGGQLTKTSEVENWPGLVEATGGSIVSSMEQHAVAMGAEILYDHIVSIDLSSRPFIANGAFGSTYQADAVIIATGAQAKWLGLESEDRYKTGGVSACATCDGFFHKGQNVVVIGGGNTAVEEALYLSKIASNVTLAVRSSVLKAERILQQRLFSTENIEVLWNREVHEIIGDAHNNVSSVQLKDTTSGSITDHACSGVFVAIGHTPATDFIAGQLATHAGGYILTKPGSTETSVPGVFAAGDVTDPTYRQAITSAGMGCMAALDAERYLAGG